MWLLHEPADSSADVVAVAASDISSDVGSNTCTVDGDVQLGADLLHVGLR